MTMTKLTASDGHAFDCWIEPAKGDRRGGIVILQEIFGVTDQLKGVARTYAAEGYEVAIPALFDRVSPATVVPFTEAPKGRALMEATQLDDNMKDVAAVVAHLKAKGGRVGVIGFCWGGGLAIRAAQVLDIDAAVSFYGTRLDGYHEADLKAPVQGHWGSLDSHAPADVLARLAARFPEMQIFTYEGADHAFANDARPNVYSPETAKTAHARTKDFFAEHLA